MMVNINYLKYISNDLLNSDDFIPFIILGLLRRHGYPYEVRNYIENHKEDAMKNRDKIKKLYQEYGHEGQVIIYDEFINSHPKWNKLTTEYPKINVNYVEKVGIELSYLDDYLPFTIYEALPIPSNPDDIDDSLNYPYLFRKEFEKTPKISNIIKNQTIENNKLINKLGLDKFQKYELDEFIKKYPRWKDIKI